MAVIANGAHCGTIEQNTWQKNRQTNFGKCKKNKIWKIGINILIRIINKPNSKPWTARMNYQKTAIFQPYSAVWCMFMYVFKTSNHYFSHKMFSTWCYLQQYLSRAFAFFSEQLNYALYSRIEESIYFAFLLRC